MMVRHSCKISTRQILPEDVQRMHRAERCSGCGQWWYTKHYRQGSSSERMWVPFNIKLWFWRRDAKKRVRVRAHRKGEF